MKKLLIIGRGQIGTALAESLAEFEVHVWKHDLDDLSTDAIEVIAPDAIVNAAGRTDLAWCEANANEAVRSNLEAPVRLYDRILEWNRMTGNTGRTVRFIHFSSGCIWDGPFREDGSGFRPDDPPSPAALYSWTKAACDAMLLARDPKNVAILRPRQVFSDSSSPRNTLVKLLRYPGLIDTPNSMSSLNTIAATVRHTIEAEEWSGVWNIYDKGIVTPFEVGVMLAEAGLRDMPNRISKSELDAFHKPKRVDTVLYDERFERVMQPANVRIELEQAISRLKLAIEPMKA